jgi:hypothetical protein
MRRTNPLITLHRKKISDGVLDDSIILEGLGVQTVYLSRSPYIFLLIFCRPIMAIPIPIAQSRAHVWPCGSLILGMVYDLWLLCIQTCNTHKKCSVLVAIA